MLDKKKAAWKLNAFTLTSNSKFLFAQNVCIGIFLVCKSLGTSICPKMYVQQSRREINSSKLSVLRKM